MSPDPDYQQTHAKYLKTLTTVHVALVAGQIIFAILSLVLNKKIMINVRFTDDPLVVIVPVAAVCGFIVSQSLYRQKIGSVSKMQSLNGKLKVYQSALLIRFAALEAPSLFGIVAFLLTGILFFLLISILIIGYFISIKPTRQNITAALGLSYKDQEDFQ